MTFFVDYMILCAGALLKFRGQVTAGRMGTFLIYKFMFFVHFPFIVNIYVLHPIGIRVCISRDWLERRADVADYRYPGHDRVCIGLTLCVS